MKKRCIDVVGALFGLVFLSPLITIVAIISLFKMGRPIVFSQIRAGYQGKPIRIYKFRSMTNGKDENGNLLPDENRLTKYGLFLRRWSLDELPQLFNILKGDLSIVGPRPLHMNYLPLYSKKEARRHEVKPGITGWAQINGRNEISWQEKFAYDVWYVDNQSFLLDLKIICLTIPTIIRGNGINMDGQVTAPTFEGSSTDSVNQQTNTEVLG